VLDSARLQHLLAHHCEIDVHDVHTYVLGEHGDSEFAAWSLSHVGGMTFEQYCPFCNRCANGAAKRREIEAQVRDSAYQIIERKGATYFAIGLALVKITEAILRGQNTVLTVSAVLEGEFGLDRVCLGVPCIVSTGGIGRIIESKLPDDELEALTASAAVLKQAIAVLQLGAPVVAS